MSHRLIITNEQYQRLKERVEELENEIIHLNNEADILQELLLESLDELRHLNQKVGLLQNENERLKQRSLFLSQ